MSKTCRDFRAFSWGKFSWTEMICVKKLTFCNSVLVLRDRLMAFVQRTPLSSVVVAAAHRGEAAQHSTQHTAHRGDKCFRSGAGFGQNSEKRRGTGRDCIGQLCWSVLERRQYLWRVSADQTHLFARLSWGVRSLYSHSYQERVVLKEPSGTKPFEPKL